MPCYDPLADVATSRNQTDKINKLTRMLCGIMTELPTASRNRLYRAVPDLSAWWHAHQEADAKRAAAEKKEATKKQKALKAYNKLTTEERKLLGIRQPV